MKNSKYKIIPYNSKYSKNPKFMIIREIYSEDKNKILKIQTIIKNVNKEVAENYLNTL